MLGAAEFLPGVDQALMDRIELVGALRDDVALDRLFEPGPLKDRGFENRGRRIRVVLQQFRRAPAVVAEVQPAVEAGVAAAPALGQQRPEGFGYFQPAQIFFVVDRAADQFEAHRVDLAGGRLDPPFDLVQRERVIGPFVPIAFAVDGVKVNPALSAVARQSSRSGQAMRCMERSNRHHGGGRRGRDHAAGAARRRSRDRSGGSKACRPDQRPARSQARNPAAAPGPSTRADRCTSHQCQHHTTRAFHGWDPVLRLFGERQSPSPAIAEASESLSLSRHRAANFSRRRSQRRAPNEPKPPRCALCEPESEVPEDEWLEEESLL